MEANLDSTEVCLNDASAFEDKYKLSVANQLWTIVGSVWSTQSKKIESFRVGIATIFLVTAFSTLILSVSYLQKLLFIQSAQLGGSDIDLIVTTQKAFDKMINLNTNPYSQNPFLESDDT